jgi:F0F1-type ATP synthase gamma subunit
MVSKKTVWASIQYLRKFKDISKAVQLVAIAKLRKLNRVLDSREYALSMATVFCNINWHRLFSITTMAFLKCYYSHR